jgi:isocitrate lyase
MTGASRFRELLSQDGMIVAPGAYDCITAKLIEQAGFAAVYMTGAGTAATLGYPDFGLVTMSEMVANAGRIAATVDVPIIADADTGYGNELNVFRTVREFESRGVAGIHIEDQEFPKKCGHLEGKQIIPREDYLAKIRAAAAARRDADFLIIARTDARAVAGLDEAVARANAALAAEADMVFVEAPQLPQCRVSSTGRACSMSCEVGKRLTSTCGTPKCLATSSRSSLGLLIKSVVGICDKMLSELKKTHRHPPPIREMTVPEMFRRFGADEWDSLRERFRSPLRNAAE